MIELKGLVEKISYESSETGFTVARVHDGKKLITVVGSLLSPPVGAELLMTGTWENHPRYGPRFRVHTSETTVPHTLSGLKKYLGSGMIPGLGEKMAARIVDHFGRETIRVLDSSVDRLCEVEGIGKKRLEGIRDAWSSQRYIRDIMIFLRSHGAGTGFAAKIYRRYENNTIKVLKENPYVLASDVQGIGFRTADTIASNMGFSKTSSFRICAGVLFYLHQLTEEGHVFYPFNRLVQLCSEMLEVSEELVSENIGRLSVERKIIIDDNLKTDENNGSAVYLSYLFFSENGLARRLTSIFSTTSGKSFFSSEKELAWLERRLSLRLAERQKKAVAAALENKSLVVTGGPGTGKTTIINAILTVFRRYERRILLAAPTGRAAKRMSETTGLSARTIHRLLEFSFKKGGFQRNEERPLSCDVLVVDEASMIDIVLMYQLVRAVPPDAVLILVGDVNQLPSVGPGNVLSDIIDSGAVPVVRLTEIFRQAEQSRIIVNAHKINRGEMPHTGRFSAGDDYCFIEQEDPERLARVLVELVKNRIPRRFNLDPFTDIQVLTPMHKGSLGSESLNSMLQDALNPDGKTLVRGRIRLRVADRVMQMKNNYDKDVFNGDTGCITVIDEENQTVHVDFEGREVVYDNMELDELSLAYAISIHKSQGSEYPAVVMPVTTQHYVLLQRNLLYTGITRGRELVVVLGTRKAVAMAVKNHKTAMRYTGLSPRLKKTDIS